MTTGTRATNKVSFTAAGSFTCDAATGRCAGVSIDRGTAAVFTASSYPSAREVCLPSGA